MTDTPPTIEGDAPRVLFAAHSGRAFRVLAPTGIDVAGHHFDAGSVVSDVWLEGQGAKLQVFRLVIDLGEDQDFDDLTAPAPPVDEEPVADVHADDDIISPRYGEEAPDGAPSTSAAPGDDGDPGAAAVDFDPAEHTIAEVLEYLNEHFDPATLEAMLAAETAEDGKNRSTLVDELNRRIAAATPPAGSTSTE